MSWVRSPLLLILECRSNGVIVPRHFRQTFERKYVSVVLSSKPRRLRTESHDAFISKLMADGPIQNSLARDNGKTVAVDVAGTANESDDGTVYRDSDGGLRDRRACAHLWNPEERAAIQRAEMLCAVCPRWGCETDRSEEAPHWRIACWHDCHNAWKPWPIRCVRCRFGNVEALHYGPYYQHHDGCILDRRQRRPAVLGGTKE